MGFKKRVLPFFLLFSAMTGLNAALASDWKLKPTGMQQQQHHGGYYESEHGKHKEKHPPVAKEVGCDSTLKASNNDIFVIQRLGVQNCSLGLLVAKGTKVHLTCSFQGDCNLQQLDFSTKPSEVLEEDMRPCDAVQALFNIDIDGQWGDYKLDIKFSNNGTDDPMFHEQGFQCRIEAIDEHAPYKKPHDDSEYCDYLSPLVDYAPPSYHHDDHLKIESKILHGDPASPKDFPWQAQLWTGDSYYEIMEMDYEEEVHDHGSNDGGKYPPLYYPETTTAVPWYAPEATTTKHFSIYPTTTTVPWYATSEATTTKRYSTKSTPEPQSSSASTYKASQVEVEDARNTFNKLMKGLTDALADYKYAQGFLFKDSSKEALQMINDVISNLAATQTVGFPEALQEQWKQTMLRVRRISSLPEDEQAEALKPIVEEILGVFNRSDLMEPFKASLAQFYSDRNRDIAIVLSRYYSRVKDAVFFKEIKDEIREALTILQNTKVPKSTQTDLRALLKSIRIILKEEADGAVLHLQEKFRSAIMSKPIVRFFTDDNGNVLVDEAVVTKKNSEVKVDGQRNVVYGSPNIVSGNDNKIHGNKNFVTGDDNILVGDGLVLDGNGGRQGSEEMIEEIFGEKDREAKEATRESRDKKESKGLGYLCGATLISSKHILTAAHCVVQVPLKMLTVRLGCTNDHKCKEVSKVACKIIHPKFDAATFENDIAILELKHPVELKKGWLAPACLPKPCDNIDPNYSPLIELGWGKTELNYPKHGDYYGWENPHTPYKAPHKPVFKKAIVHTVCDEICSEVYSMKLYNSVCVKSGSGLHCEGDAGGFVGRPREMDSGYYGGWTVDGVVSFGPEKEKYCSKEGIKGVAETAPHYLWIKKITGMKLH